MFDLGSPPGTASTSADFGADTAASEPADPDLDSSVLARCAELWNDIDAIHEYAAKAAILATPFERILESYATLFRQGNEYLTARFDREAGSFRADVELQQATIAEGSHALGELRERRNTLLAELPVLSTDEAVKGSVLQAALRRIYAARADGRNARELGQFRHARTLGEMKAETANEERERNRELFSARAEAIQHELNATRSLLEDSRSLNHELQKRGATRNVARFLNWAGYVSFAGIGLIVSQLAAWSDRHFLYQWE